MAATIMAAARSVAHWISTVVTGWAKNVAETNRLINSGMCICCKSRPAERFSTECEECLGDNPI